MQNDIFLSIVTPTYNRAELLTRVYESLLEQSDYDFEWIVIDDGSSDDTLKVVEGFRTDLFNIKVVSKPNGGKHTALNESHKYIDGEYVLILDSDDYLTKDAVETVKKEWECFSENETVYELIFLRGQKKEDSIIPFCTVEQELKPVNFYKTKRNVAISADCCEVIRSDVFKLYPFPEYENERFIGESALWDRAAQGRNCVYVNKIIYLCDYLEGGLTKSGRAMRLKNLQGGMFTANLKTTKEHTISCRIKNYILYTCYGFFRNFKLDEIIKSTNKGLLLYLCLPIGWLLFHYWRKKYNHML